jgi:hypothetical protein
MRIYKDKTTGKYKYSTRSSELFDTKQACQWAYLDRLADSLANIRKKYNDGVLGYGK